MFVTSVANLVNKAFKSTSSPVPKMIVNPSFATILGYGGRVIHIPAGPEKPIPVADVANYLDEFVQGVLDFAQEENAHYDIIHSHYWLSGMVGEQLRRSLGHGTPIVQMFHTLRTHEK